MRPLNGKARMTRDERNARRRELSKDPFRKALAAKWRKAWREKNKEKLRAQARVRYKKNREEAIERSKRWRAANPQKVRLASRRWHVRHREHLRAKEKARYADPAFRERKRMLRKIRDADPANRARQNFVRRIAYERNKHSMRYMAWKIRYHLEPRWKELMESPVEAIERYRRRCTVETWSYFVRWARARGRFMDPQKTPSSRRA